MSLNQYYGPPTPRRKRRNVPNGLISQAECAKRLGISQMRVSQIERKALAKLRAALGDP